MSATLWRGASAPPSRTGPEPPPLLDWTEGERELIATLSPLPPLPPDETNAHADSAVAAELGRRLFHDAQLSPDGAFSCATCRRQELGLAPLVATYSMP